MSNDQLKGFREHYYPRFELIEAIFLERIAKALTEGAIKYGKTPEEVKYNSNWKKLSTDGINDIQRHAFSHIVSHMHEDTTEDHLAHAACNIMFMMWFQEQSKSDSTVTTNDAVLSNPLESDANNSYPRIQPRYIDDRLAGSVIIHWNKVEFTIYRLNDSVSWQLPGVDKRDPHQFTIKEFDRYGKEFLSHEEPGVWLSCFGLMPHI